MLNQSAMRMCCGSKGDCAKRICANDCYVTERGCVCVGYKGHWSQCLSRMPWLRLQARAGLFGYNNAERPRLALYGSIAGMTVKECKYKTRRSWYECMCDCCNCLLFSSVGSDRVAVRSLALADHRFTLASRKAWRTFLNFEAPRDWRLNTCTSHLQVSTTQATIGQNEQPSHTTQHRKYGAVIRELRPRDRVR